jgi:hypothetical protein
MFAAPFDYYRAGSIGEAHQLLRKYPGAKLLVAQPHPAHEAAARHAAGRRDIGRT